MVRPMAHLQPVQGRQRCGALRWAPVTRAGRSGRDSSLWWEAQDHTGSASSPKSVSGQEDILKVFKSQVFPQIWEGGIPRWAGGRQLVPSL